MQENKQGTTVMDVDGSVMEGGGQVIRISLTLAALLGHELRLSNIRAGRSKPGLQNQHLAGVGLVGNLCGGKLSNAVKGALNMTMRPSPEALDQGDFTADPGTAGSICLILQAALLPAMFAAGPCKLTIRGGTNTDFAPQIEFYNNVFFEIVKRMGVSPTVEVKRKGYYPKGGGEVVVTTGPIKRIDPLILLDRGEITSIKGSCFTAGGCPRRVGEEMASTATRILRKNFPKIDVDIDVKVEPPNYGNGSGIVLVANTSTGCVLGGSGLGRGKKTSPSKVATHASDELIEAISSNACVDKWLADQLIVYMALADGESAFSTGPLTLHTRTAIHFAQNLTGAKFTIDETTPELNIVRCIGIGFTK